MAEGSATPDRLRDLRLAFRTPACLVPFQEIARCPRDRDAGPPGAGRPAGLPLGSERREFSLEM